LLVQRQRTFHANRQWRLRGR